MSRILLLLLILSAGFSFGQQDNLQINNKLVAVSFDKKPQTKSIRKLVAFKKKSALLNPLNFLGAGFLFAYQNVLSEQIQANCVYHTSCSEFTKLSIARYGIFIGTLKGFNQLSECAANAKYEHPPMYLDQEEKIINGLEEKIK